MRAGDVAAASDASSALLSAQERSSQHLAKVRVAGSNPVVRSTKGPAQVSRSGDDLSGSSSFCRSYLGVPPTCTIGPDGTPRNAYRAVAPALDEPTEEVPDRRLAALRRVLVDQRRTRAGMAHVRHQLGRSLEEIRRRRHHIIEKRTHHRRQYR
jgi:hypothetical protein